ncbi:unnamed protein product [Bursaphelenchus xylophilus]|uniref:(pine wood nematode) hypothetical protein n=1 Tax=Bursaphelenchus xylophilus TaxID=6326 RepID=A0A1I7S318_BURXY|nr:unnamed protein product [Bursaphelenchus xylophilus]CAG9116065.1 unnamed protein product [Bursaphelenchus xylophilus]
MTLRLCISLSLLFAVVSGSNSTAFVCGIPPNEYYSSTPCLQPRIRIGVCPQDTIKIADCNGNRVFCSGFNANRVQIPGICYNGACCANQNSQSCINNQGMTTPLICSSNCPQLAPCDRVSGYCCMHRSRINGMCPDDSINAGLCTYPNSVCYVNGAQGRCSANYVCCVQAQQQQCPSGSRPSGIQCQFNQQSCNANGLRGICQSGQCCVFSQDPQQCSGGGTVVGNGYCNGDNSCRQYSPQAYCDLSIGRCCVFTNQQCQNGEIAQGSCSMSGNICQTNGGQGTCRNGICCVYRCATSQSTFNGQLCSTQSQCRVNSFTDIAVCENGHCCIGQGNQPNQCPYGTSINYNLRCSTDNDCVYNNRNGRCVNNYCCVSQGSNGEDVCRGYGMAYTGFNCVGNTQICASQTQTTAICRDGYCCSQGGGTNPGTGLGICYNGEQSSKLCRYRNDCGNGQLCVNGVCCRHTGNEWKFACGGITAVASCTQQGSCASQMSCTSSNYCCECPYGQSSGSCKHGCPIGYSCAQNGYCCPSCQNGREPVGSCFEGRCGAQYRCRPGNICCPS